VLVRQRPGSARGVLFITIEDETGIANIVVWPDLFDRQRRVILSAGMIAVAGRVQREGEVVHVIARTLADLSALLRSLGEREDASPPQGQDNEANLVSSPDLPPRPQIKLRTRDFR
jgi:error-prone DNA polymerase